jgi:hypothetical protein
MPATKRKFAAPPGLLINSSTTVDSSIASTTPSTGAFVISGGVGIGDTLNVKGHINLWNDPNTFYTGLRSGTLTTSTYYILPSNFPGTGTSVLQSDTSGALAWVPMTAASSGTGTTAANINVVLAGTSASHSLLFTPTSGTASGVAVSSNSTLVYNPSTDLLSVSGLAVTSGAGSSNATTGALVVTGGVGIGGSLNVTNKARFAEEVKLTSLSSNALSIDGSGSVAYTWTVGTTLTSGRYNLSSDLCLVPVGGSQSVLQTFWGLQLVGNNQLTPTNYSPTVIGVRDAFGVLIPNQQAASVGLAVIGHASQTGDLQIWTTPSGLATTTLLSVRSNGQLYSYVSIASTSPTTGALVVTGSVGIGQSVSLSGRLQMFNGANYTAFVSSATGNTVYTLPATSPATGSSVLQSTAGGVMSWVAMSSGSSSGGVTDGSVQYKSGSGFAATNSFFYDTSIYALRLSNFPAGEATSQTSAALKVEQTTGTFNGSINGTMIAVNANNGFTGDLLNLQTNAITKFKVDAAGAIGASSDIVTVSTTASTNTTSGALQVRGGAGIAQSLFVGGTLNVGADLIISGLTTLTYTSEKLTTKTSATGTVTHDLSTGSIFYHSSISNNFTANITNVPTTNDRAIGVTLVLAQGVTPYMSTALQIDGSAQTIKWVNNITPTGTASKVDIVGFSLIRTGSAWTVLGQYSTYG